MASARFTLVVHNHQPVGNFDHVFEEAFRNAYLLFFEALARHPHVRIGLHQTGILWEWMERRRPGVLDLLRPLVQCGQIELLTGGFYEPILPLIPDRDK